MCATNDAFLQEDPIEATLAAPLPNMWTTSHPTNQGEPEPFWELNAIFSQENCVSIAGQNLGLMTWVNDQSRSPYYGSGTILTGLDSMSFNLLLFADRNLRLWKLKNVPKVTEVALKPRVLHKELGRKRPRMWLVFTLTHGGPGSGPGSGPAAQTINMCWQEEDL